VKISKILQAPSVKILLFIHEKREVRYTDLAKLISSRGALSTNLKSLETEELLSRRVVTSKPIHTYYSLTEKGLKAANYFKGIRTLFPQDNSA
jgi:DNA-binding HxlR family transcriptional regulator